MSQDELLHRAETEPINVDISDYSDGWCEGFLAGQRSVLEEVFAGRLALPAAPGEGVALKIIRAEIAEARLAELREAVASALTSLATGPAKDGYAYTVLDAALAATA